MLQEISYVAVALFLDSKLESSIIEISEKFYNKYNSWWRLSPNKFPPHISLWLGYIPTKNESALINEVQNIVQSLNPIQLELGELDIVPNGKHYYIKQNICRTKQLDDLHYLFLERLNQYREGYIEPKYLDADKQKSMSSLMIDNINKYGTRFVAELFEPHISISYIDRMQASINDIREQIPRLIAQQKSTKIIVFKQKESGKSIDVLTEISIL